MKLEIIQPQSQIKITTVGIQGTKGDVGTSGTSGISGTNGVSGIAPNYSTAPNTNQSGSLYFNTVNFHFYGWNGAQWKQLDN
jgi:hypothetical protein